MEIIVADYLYIDGRFAENLAIAFDTHIQAVDLLENLLSQYPDAKLVRSKPYTVLYPGFINTHVHLEFSANKTALKYGSFMSWLDSIIEHRDDLLKDCNNKIIHKECEKMMRSGITTFGAISSFGTELQVCQEIPQRVIFFNELIGSNAQYADMLYNDFLERIKVSQNGTASSRITPAIAIHSPYSVHPVILQRAVALAKQNKMPLTTHFLESQAEREWLEKGTGEFKSFFEKFFGTSIPVTTIKEFMHAFDTYPTHFVHCVQATDKELSYLAQKGHTIAHCVRSNRYLGCGRLPIEKLRKLNIPYSIATDGLSSNDSLSIFDEFRAALMLHHQGPLQKLALKFIKAATEDAAKALGTNGGSLHVGKDADFALITLPELPKRTEEIALWSILHTKEVDALYIEGEKYV
ncbi:MAG: metal-dependent hydrolase [Sulfurovum sp.]|nr:metal-dependent hydrolase [Sulfurovum sp.]